MLFRFIIFLHSCTINHPSKSKIKVLCSIGKGRYFNSTYLTFSLLLFFYFVWMNIGLFCSRCVFYIDWHFNTFVIVTFITILSYFSVCFCIKILRFDSRNVANITWNMCIDSCVLILLLFCTLICRYIAHISNNWSFLTLYVYHMILLISYIYLFRKITIKESKGNLSNYLFGLFETDWHWFYCFGGKGILKSSIQLRKTQRVVGAQPFLKLGPFLQPKAKLIKLRQQISQRKLLQ